MRVLSRTSDLLVIEDKPWVLGLFLSVFILAFVAGSVAAVLEGSYGLAAVLLGIAGGAGAIVTHFVERVWLILDRAAGTVELRRRNLRRFRRDVFALADLGPDGILLQADEGTERIALRIASRAAPVPVTAYYQSGGKVRACARAAEDWLAEPAG